MRVPNVSELRARGRSLGNSDIGRTAWLAGAMIANNVLGLITAVVFARLLSDYGALASLIGYLIILTVFGQALQVATAREGVLGHLGTGPELRATLRRWARSLALLTLALTIVSILLRAPIAGLVGVRHDHGGTWAAAIGIPAGCIYLAESILRGALQSVGDYRSVGLSLIVEAASRLVCGTALIEIGLGVGGAYLASLFSYLAVTIYLAWRLDAQLPHADGAVHGARLGLGRHVAQAAIPILGIAVIQLLQNLDIIIAKHRMTETLDNSYAAVAVAAKVLIWVAMGASFYLVPETSKRHDAGEPTLGVLARSLLIVAVCAVPCLLIYAFGAHPLMQAVFGTKKAVASNSLLPLGAAFTVLAATYLGVQYMLALKRTWFLAAIALVAVIEPLLLLSASRRPTGFALIVLGVQALGALLIFTLALWPGTTPRRAGSEETELVGT